jgi:hypothetical protein
VQPAKESLTVVGYLMPGLEPAAQLYLAGGWSPTRGWVKAPMEEFASEWTATSWQFLERPDGVATTIRSDEFLPLSAEDDDAARYSLVTEVRAGVGVSHAQRPCPRVARRQGTDRLELCASTRELLRRHGIRPPSRPRILESWRVDLNGDGRDEVLWTARSREGWRSPYPDHIPYGPRADDYALVGLRYLTPAGVRSEALAWAPEVTEYGLSGVEDYTIMCPLDIDGDGRMEILVCPEGWEEDYGLLGFTFDGRKVRRIPW